MWRDALTRRFPRLARLPGDCYVVGGAVRDLLLGREPVDVDVASHDPLGAARTVGDRIIRLGDSEHLSAWRVVADGQVYDFAEILGGDIHRDLRRRDFTVNAMAVEMDTERLLDPHGGQQDLQTRTLRMIRAANFDDDPLRTLKGVRMAVRFDMEIERATLDAIRERAARIVEVAPERVTYELAVIFSSERVRHGIELLELTGLAEPLGLKPRPLLADDVSLAGSYALLVGDPGAHARRWRWSRELLHEVVALQQLIDRHDRVALYDAGEKVARQLPAVLRALGRAETLDWPEFSARALLTGEEIAAATGLAPGKELGLLKRRLLEAQIGGRVRTRAEAEAFVRSGD